MASQGCLTLYPTTRVRVGPVDRLHSGLDAEHIEIQIEGEMHLFYFDRVVLFNPLTWERIEKETPVVFEALEPGTRWAGIHARTGVDLSSVIIRDTFADAPLQDQATWVEEAVDSFADGSTQPDSLLPNYPNPFDVETTLPYTLAAAGNVQLDIYNALGQRVQRLVEAYQQAGAHGGRVAGAR